MKGRRVRGTPVMVVKLSEPVFRPRERSQPWRALKRFWVLLIT